MNKHLTLLDIAHANGSDDIVGLIEEVIDQVPELAVLPSRTIRGTSFKTWTRTALPSTAFRGANEGVATGKSKFKSDIVEMFILDGQIEMDVRVAEADERGVARMLGLEASGTALSALLNLGKQIYYGQNNDAKGFPGLKAFTPFGGELTLDATGTTADTASSVFAMRLGEQDTSLLWGNDTTLELGEWRKQQLTDGDGKKYTGFVNDLGGWTGLQMASKWSAGRICNLTADAGKGLTESLLLDFLDKFPAAKKPTLLTFSGRSMTQLRKSMQPSIVLKGTSLSGAAVSESQAKAHIEESTGCKIIVSDSIVNNDAIEA